MLLPSVQAYLRKSRALGDPDDPKLLDHHESVLLRTAGTAGLTLAPEHIIREIGSAETIAGRPRFKALLEFWERLPRDTGGVILVTELERLSRGTMTERGRIADALRLANIHLLTPTRRYDLRLPEDLLMAQVQWIFAEHELGKYKYRKSLKLEELLRHGRTPNGRPPFGYAWDPKALDFAPDPRAFPILRRWCEEVFSLSIDRIANKWGVGRWLVYQSLTNPVICGWPARRTGNPGEGRKERLPRDRWRWPERPGAYEPACTREQWEQIQSVLRERAWRRAKTGADENGWCRDVLRFLAVPNLAVHLGTDSNYRARPDDPRHRTYQVIPPQGPRLYIPRGVVHTAAETALAALFSRPALLRHSVARYRAHQARSAPRYVEPNAAGLAGERDRAERLLVDLLRRELTEESEIQRAAIARLRRETENDIRRLASELRELSSSPSASPDLDLLEPLLTRKLAHLDEWWPELESGLRRRYVNGFLARIWADVRRVPGSHKLVRTVARVEVRDWLEQTNAP